MKCPHCNNENPPQARFCATCGKDMTVLIASDQTAPGPIAPPSQPAYPQPGPVGTAPGAYPPAQGYGPTGFPQQPFTGAPVQSLRKGPAITALVIGIVSFVTGSFFLIGALVGVVFGIVTVVKIKKRPAEYSGTGIAMTGIVLSVFSIGVGAVAFITFIVVPNMAKAAVAANELVAMQRLKSIAAAEEVFHAANGQYAEFGELSQEENLGFEPVSNGYKFEIAANDDEFTATATPRHYGKSDSGVRSFFVSEDDVIRAADKNGAPADSSDPPLQ